MSAKTLSTVLLLGCLVILNYGCGQEEPTYQGKSLSQWIQQLGDGNESIRIEAASALGKIKDKRAVEPLAKTLIKEELGRAPAIAIRQSLTEIGPDSKAIDFLIEKLRNGGEREGAQAALALGAMGGERAILVLLQRLSLDKTAEERLQTNDFKSSIFKKLVISGIAMREDNVKDVVGILRKQSKNEAVVGGYMGLGYEQVDRFVTMGVLMEIGSPAVNPVAELLQEDDYYLRTIAILTLGLIGREKKATANTLCPHLVLALKDRDERLRKVAASALEQISGKSFGEDQGSWNEWCKNQK